MGFNASPSSLHTAAHNIFEILNDASDSDKTKVPSEGFRGISAVLGEVSAAQLENKASITSRGDAKQATASSKTTGHNCETNKSVGAEDTQFVLQRIRNHRPTVTPKTFEPPNTLPKITEGCPESYPETVSSVNSKSNHQVERHLAATPLSPSNMLTSQSTAGSTAPITISQLPPSYEESTLHIPEPACGGAAFVSPNLSTSFQSQRSDSGSMAEALSPSGSFTGSRIEDSLEELDKLEDELEAIDAVTSLEKLSVADSPAKPSPACASTTGRPVKGVSMLNLQPAASNKTPSNKSAPIRRSSTSQLCQTIESSPARKPVDRLAPSSVNKRNSLLARPPSSKSAKPPTVPNFELPGEAVARRLRQQREARRLQQEEASKVAASPSKPRSLTKPCFELPGEAISRRKREEREARLKTQAEEEKRRREFKARPLRQSIGPSTLPRETATSSARAAQIQQDAASGRVSAISTRQKRASIGPGLSAPSLLTQSSLRTSVSNVTVGTFRESDAETVSVASTAGDDTARKKIRRKSTFFETVQEARVRERQEKEMAMKAAREQAAERSRMASREWAEKQKRRSVVVRDVTPANGRG